MTDQRNASDRFRRYTPLAILSACILIAVFGLPSMLNLPQSNPGEVAEYAPVPPNDNSAAPPGGNFAGLGLGNGSNLTESVSQNTGGGGGLLTASGIKSQFRCVIINGTPHQTEDPLSPPCVPYYQGDNGGSTYKGVKRNEIDVVYYIACSTTNNTFSPTSKGSEGANCGEIDDLDQPPSDNDFLYTRGLKRYAAYFNSRYQTYKRHVHMWAFYGHYSVSVSGPGGCQNDCRRNDATQTIDTYHPFSVLTNGGIADFMDAYADAMAQKKVVNFGGAAHNDSFYRQYPGLLWNYAPSFEKQAGLFASYLCQKAVPTKVSFSGNASDMGKKRKFGIIYYDDTGDNYYVGVKPIIERKLAECGVPKGSIPEASYTDTGSVSGDPSTGPAKATKLSQFKNDGVTTILWMGNPNGEWANQANRLRWYPEWIVFGDGGMEDFVNARYVNTNVWQHAWVVSNVTKIGRQDDQPCALALREVDPNFPTTDIPWDCGFYDNLRQMFTGIQVAGPDLTPHSVDQGFHQIPAVASTDPQVPACFYPQGDYTCVKDATPMWYDPNGQIRGWSGSGCWRNVEDGKRYLESKWPPGDVTAQKSAKDECNGYTSNGSFNPYTNTG
jgi:hypothetical protein